MGRAKLPEGFRRSQLTKAQLELLKMLDRAYDEDVAVAIGTYTQWSEKPSVQRHVFTRLSQLGLVRWSEPGGHFACITDAGRELVGEKAAA